MLLFQARSRVGGHKMRAKVSNKPTIVWSLCAAVPNVDSWIRGWP
jgi:hypothetical protein